MILKLYSIYDKKTQIYHPPHYCHNAAHAVRMFQQIFSKIGSTFSLYPDDFQLWELGEFNDDTGKVKALEKPTLICGAADLVPPKNPESIEKEELPQKPF